MFKKKLMCLLAASVLAAATVGCSTSKDLFAPAPTPSVKNKFNAQQVWSVSTQGVGNFFSQLGPTVYGQIMYVAGRDGRVYALDGNTGNELWRVDLSNEEENEDKRSARLSGGMSASGGLVAVGSENGYLYVLNSKDGSIYLKLYLGAEILTRPAFSASGDKLFVLDGIGAVHGIDLVSKQEIWTSGDSSGDLHLRSQARPVAVGDELVITGLSSGHVMMISQDSGFVLKQVTVGQSIGANDIDRIADVSSTPLLLGANMYSTAYNGGFVKFSLAEGIVKTRLNYRSSKDIAYDDHFFIITADNGYVGCLRRDDNTEVWVNTDLKYRNVTAPAIYGNYVVVGDYEGFVYFINLNDGKIASKLQISEDPIYVTPIVLGNCIIIYSSTGEINVYCYDPNGIVIPKKRYTDLELATGNAAAIIASSALSPVYDDAGASEEVLLKRRQEAERLVAKINAQEREAEARYREYMRQKAEYERQVKEYEQKKREELSGFGLAPSSGIKSGEEEFVEDDE